jgi:hypothetical protein
VSFLGTTLDRRAGSQQKDQESTEQGHESLQKSFAAVMIAAALEM